MVDLYFINGGKAWDLVCSHISLQRAVRSRQNQILKPELIELHNHKCAKPEEPIE